LLAAIVTITVDEQLLEQINDFRFGNRIETKSEAIRQLILRGLNEFPKDKRKKSLKPTLRKYL
jgi:metal-responsive CopG/Arc/MetJ family transcriptional regulator